MKKILAGLVSILCIVCLAVSLAACGGDAYSGNFSKVATEEEVATALGKLDNSSLESWNGVTLSGSIKMGDLLSANAKIQMKVDSNGDLSAAYFEINGTVKNSDTGKKETLSLKAWADGQYAYIDANILGDKYKFKVSLTDDSLSAGVNAEDTTEAPSDQMSSTILGVLSMFDPSTLSSYNGDGSTKFYIDEKGSTTKIKIELGSDDEEYAFMSNTYMIFLFKNNNFTGCKAHIEIDLSGLLNGLLGGSGIDMSDIDTSGMGIDFSSILGDSTNLVIDVTFEKFEGKITMPKASDFTGDVPDFNSIFGGLPA